MQRWINEWQFGEVCGHGALQSRWCKGSNCNLTSISSGLVATITVPTLRRRALFKNLFNLWECLGHTIYRYISVCVCVCVCVSVCVGVKRLARLSPHHTVSSKTALGLLQELIPCYEPARPLSSFSESCLHRAIVDQRHVKKTNWLQSLHRFPTYFFFCRHHLETHLFLAQLLQLESWKFLALNFFFSFSQKRPCEGLSVWPVCQRRILCSGDLKWNNYICWFDLQVINKHVFTHIHTHTHTHTHAHHNL